MMGVILNDWNDDGCGCLWCRAGGVLLAPLLPSPSPRPLSRPAGEGGLFLVNGDFGCCLGALEGVGELGFEGFCKDVKDGCWGL